MRIGLIVNPMGGGGLAGAIDQIRRAAAAGLHAAWIPQIFGLDALSVLAVAGREVPDIELGTAVVPTYPRHPIALAGQALTTQAAIGGRLVLGVGPSHQLMIEGMHGLPYVRPARHTREYLTVLRALVVEGSVSFNGEMIQANTMPGSARVADAEPFPILISALGPAMLRLAGELADGTITWLAGPATLAARIVPSLVAAAGATGRPSPRVVAGLPVCLTADPAAVREKAVRQFGLYGTLPAYARLIEEEGVSGPADLAIVGDAAAVTAGVRALAAAGATDFSGALIGPPADQAATLALLGELAR